MSKEERFISDDDEELKYLRAKMLKELVDHKEREKRSEI